MGLFSDFFACFNRDPPLYEEAKSEVESRYGSWYEEPLYQLGSPDYNRDQYAATMRQIYAESGWHFGSIPLTWQNLTVTLPVERGPEIHTMKTSALRPIQRLLGVLTCKGRMRDKVTHNILEDVSGYVMPGECLLILSPPGAGATTLLRILAGRRSGLDHVQGQVRYNGRDIADESKIPGIRHMARFIGQEDIHFAPFSVRDTLRFAAECMIADYFPYAQHTRDVRCLAVPMALGIEHTLDTPVGNNALRGVSGGEKKRVTIGEMVVGTLHSLLFMDNFSKGLDSATTLRICKRIQHLTKQNNIVFVGSLQQPSNEAFNCFDKILVLDRGKCVFFGAREQVEPYFNSLGFQRPPARSLPDFIATVTDPELRTQMIPDETQITTPSSVDEFAEAFQNSLYHKECIEKLTAGITIDRENLKPEYRARVNRDALQSRWRQTGLLVERAAKLELLDKRTVISVFITFAILGLILGSLFFRLPYTRTGAELRSGLIFLCTTFTGIQAMGTVSQKYEQKSVYKKQHEAGFYQASPFIFAYVLISLVKSSLLTFIYSICLYFLAGLNLSDAGIHYAIFWLILWWLSLTIDCFVRMMSVLVSAQDIVTAIMGVYVILCIFFSGYLLQKSEIPSWFIWCYWMSPFHYAVEALMINEFLGTNFYCQESELIPRNSFVPLEYRICQVSTGEAYISSKGFSTQYYMLWVNFAVLFGMTTLFTTMAAIFQHRIGNKSSPYRESSTQKDEDEELEEVSKYLSEAESTALNDSKLDVVDIESLSQASGIQPVIFTWKSLSYMVPIGKSENKKLLHEISGIARPGRLVALMGASGAGKTTLLDVLALRKTKGIINGETFVNGRPQKKKTFSFISGYCEQTDIHMEKQTVRESLLFAARLRLPNSMSDQDKVALVERTIDVLKLRDVTERIVGSAESGLGLSSEARKRLTIGIELVANPSVLFLDEPTSGLDTRAAMMVMDTMRRAASIGCSIMCTIHQPSEEIFEQFDDLLLLQRGGQTVFFGETGKQSRQLTRYFEENGAPAIEKGRNPADYMLDVINGVLKKPETELVNWSEIWDASTEKEELMKLIEDENHVAAAQNQDIVISEQPGFKTQTIENVKRSFVNYWRTPEYNFTRLVSAVIQSLIIGLAYFQLDNDQLGYFSAAAAIFLSGMAAKNNLNGVIRPALKHRVVYYRETAAGTYTAMPYFIAAGLVEIPFALAAVTLFSVIYWFLIGFDPSHFGFFYLTLVLFTLWAVFTGQAIAFASPNITVANAIVPLINMLSNVLAGFIIPQNAIPPYYIWIYWINPNHYYNAAQITNAISGEPYYCKPDQYVLFPKPPAYPDCESIPPGEYSSSTSDTGMCAMCPVTNGDQPLKQVGLLTYNNWINVATILGFGLLSRVLGYFALVRFKYLDR